MNTLPMKPDYIAVAAVDFSELGDRALEEAAKLHDAYKDLALHVVVVGQAENELIRLPGMDMAPLRHADAIDFACRHVGKVIAALHQGGMALGLETVAVYVVAGAAAATIVELATSLDADRIILGTHGRAGLARWILGSVAEEVARNATCGVHILRPRDFFAGERLPVIQPPLQPGEHALIPATHSPTHHYVGRDAASTSRMLPVS